MAKKAVQEKGLAETNKEKDEGGGGGGFSLGDQSILTKMLEDVLESYTATLEKYIKVFNIWIWVVLCKYGFGIYIG